MRSWILGSLLTIFLAAPAQATRCSDWVRLEPGQREATLRTAFRDILDSSKAKRWTSLNKGRAEQCLIQSLQSIEIDFDNACSEGNRAPLDVLDEILMGYVRSCAG